MTTPTTLASRPSLDCTETGRPARPWWLVVGAASLLAGCAGTQLPPWPSVFHLPAPRPAPAPATSIATQPGTGAQTSPVASSSLEPLPYAAEVAQHYPDPSVRYQTPGLENGRRSFTTNDELAAMLQSLSNKTLGQTARLGLLSAGTSQQGRPIYALIATKASAISPDALDETRRPTVLLVAGQQGTDAAPTEALLVMSKELAPGGLLHPLLDKANVVLVPRANPDGFESASATTANGTSMLQDHLLLSTPEAQALAKLARNYRPAVVMDAEEFPAIHPTLEQFDALRANDVALQYGLSANVHEFVVKAEREWLHRPITDSLTQAGQRVDWVFSASPNDKTLRMATVEPTSLQNVSALKNAPSMTVQSRGADLRRTHIQRRVHTLVTALTAALNDTISRSSDLTKVQSFVTRDVASQACKGTITVATQALQTQRDVIMQDPQTGADKTVRAPWVSALELRPVQQRPRPCGYWLSASSERAVERLRLLGVQVQKVAEQAPVLSDGYVRAGDKFSVARNAIDAVPGSYYISMNQSQANVAAAALEPDTPYSYLAHGLLSGAADVARVMAPTSLVFEED